MRRIPLWILITAILGCSGVPDPAAVEDDGVPFAGSVIVVAERPVPEVKHAVGTIRAIRETTLSSRVLAQVRMVSKQAGDRVRAGEALVELDDRQVDALRSQARASHQEAIHASDELERLLEAARASESAAKDRAELARITFERFERLWDKRSVSRQEYDEAKTGLETARSEALRATRSAEAIEARRPALQARIAQAEAAIRSADASFEDATIRAPFDGRVVRRHIEPGDMATPGTPLLTVEGPEYRVEAELPESWGIRLRVGDLTGVSVDALRLSWRLPITFVDPVADPVARSLLVKVDLPTAAGMRSGLFARLAVEGDSRQAILIPHECIVERGQLTGVYVEQSEGRALLRLVRTGEALGSDIEIVSGLMPAERVVAAPKESIRDDG